MRIAIIAAIGLFSTAAIGADFPQGYWERNYGIMPQQSGAYNLTLKVADLSKAEPDVDHRLAKMGATMTSVNTGTYYNGPAYINNVPQTPARSKTVTYSIDASKADAAIKSLFEIGEMEQFSNSHQATGNQLDEIREKIRLLNDEISKNGESLKKMPIAAYFLNSQLSRLTQSRDSFEAALKKTSLNVVLVEKTSSSAKSE